MIFGLIGEPATGKTTIAKDIIKHFGEFELIKYKLLRFMINKKHKFIMLGIYGTNEVFEGTDKLSMAVQSDALAFCEKYLGKYPDYKIFFEGDRIGNASFINRLNDLGIKLHLYCLKVDDELKHDRHKQRMDTQSDKFKKAKKTKITRLIKDFKPTILLNNTDDDYNKSLNRLIKDIQNG